MSTAWTDPFSVVVAVLLVLVPGGLVAAAARLAGAWWMAAAGPFSLAITGVTGVVATWLGVPFGPIPLAVVTLAAASLAFGLSTVGRGSRPLWQPRLGSWDRAALWTAAATVVAGGVTVLPALAAMGSLDALSQSYDGVFHLNAVAYILDTGDASSFHLYRMTHPGDDVEFYPAAWHGLVALAAQLSGASVAVATNAVWAATTALIWVPGAALLTGHVIRDRGATAIGALVASAFAAFPLLLLSWGTLYPTALAYAGIPFGLAVLVGLLDFRLRHDAPLALVMAALGWVVAEVFSHPRSLPSFAVIAAPIIVIAAVRALRRVWALPRRRPLVIAGLAGGAVVLAAVGVAAWMYVWRTYDVANRPISDHLNGGPATARQTIGDAIAQSLTLSPSQALVLFPAVLLAAATLGGVVVAVRRNRMWLAIAWMLVVVLFALASGSNSDVAKLATGIWYKDQFRLFALLPIVGVPLAAGAIIEAASHARRRALTAAALTGIVVATSWLAPATAAARSDVATVFATPPAGTPGVMIDADEYAFIADIGRYVPEGEVVGGDPWNGSALVWALGGREALFPHFTGEWSADAALVASSLDRAGDDPAVCEAVDRLGLHYVLDDPGLLWGDPAEAAYFAGFHRAARSGVLTEVAHAGETILYRISACWHSGDGG